MACSSCGTPSPAPVSSCGSCSSPAPSTPCRKPPRRSYNPPNTPVVPGYFDKMMQATEGRLVLSVGENGKEAAVLDSPFPGIVHVDENGQASVQDGAVAAYVQDCCESEVSGFPVYAENPGCRALGEHPDRLLKTVRPDYSDEGLLYGHQEQCPSSRGLAPEIQPVQIKPGVLPDTGCPPQNLTLLGWNPVTPDGGCAPERPKWYEVTRIFFNKANVPVVTSLSDTIQSDPALETQRLALWETVTCPDGSKTEHLKEVEMKEFRRWVALLTRTVVQEAAKETFLGTAVLVASKLDNPLSVPDPFSGYHDALTDVAPYSGSFDMTTIPGYVKGAKKAQIRAITFVDSVGTTVGDATVVVNGLTIAQSYLNTGATFGYKNDACAYVELTDDKFSYNLQANSSDYVSMARLEILSWQ